MASKYLLDTGIILREFRGDPRAANLLDRLSATGQLVTSAVSVFETFKGCRNASEEFKAKQIFDRIPATDINYEAAVLAGRLMRKYPGIFSSERASADALIAAAAIEQGCTLVTLNTRQFGRGEIDDLSTLIVDQDAQNWTPTEN